MWALDEWKHCRRPDSISPRHVKFIYDLVMGCGFRRILEIGPANGFATSAFLQARKDGRDFSLTVCDAIITEPLMALLEKHWIGGNLHERQADSLQVFFEPAKNFDLVLINGDSRLCQVSRELGLCLYFQTGTILAQGTGGDKLHPGSDDGQFGPLFLRETLQNCLRYLVRHDELYRGDEATHRGFTFATRDINIADNQGLHAWNRMLGF